MAAPTAELVGADRLMATLDRAAGELGDLSHAGREVATTIAASARRRAPRRTGALAGSITESVDGDSAEVGTAIRYAPFVEYGPPYPQPFMAPALDEASGSIEPAYADDIGRIISHIEGA